MNNKIFTFILFIAFSFCSFVNNETGWSFDQSTLQAFYMFESIQIDGEVGVGDGSSAQECSESYCCQNPGSCDVLGAFFNGTCVGWIYVDSAGFTMVPAMGNDGGEYSQNYPQSGDSIYFRLYDTSQDRILHFDSDLGSPDTVTCTNSSGEGGDCVWTNFGIYTCSDFSLDNENIPIDYLLLSTYPNPFNPSLNIDFFIEGNNMIDLKVYDLLGNIVDTLISKQFMVSGKHSIIWEPAHISSGEYIISLTLNGNYIMTEKVTYIK